MMKIIKTNVIQNITSHCQGLGLNFIDNYFNNFEDNLIEKYSNWGIIKSEIDQGGGGEFKGEKPKFKATYSSAALCVNNFAPIKENIDKFSFLGESNFTTSFFEKNLPTGISTPYLDFYIENENSIFAFESKYTEHLTQKLPNFSKSDKTVGNLQKYINRRAKLKNLPKNFIDDVIQYYTNYDKKMYLDVSQLIKHIIGLINEPSNKKKTLVYVFWVPKNHYDFELFEIHNQEIIEFENRLKPFSNLIHFCPLSYIDLWDKIESNPSFSNHIKKVKQRYNIYHKK